MHRRAGSGTESSPAQYRSKRWPRNRIPLARRARSSCIALVRTKPARHASQSNCSRAASSLCGRCRAAFTPGVMPGMQSARR
ncbi:MAG: hypothetical protein B7X10_01350, partial [Burkholderiales bacterium 21-58-4]